MTNLQEAISLYRRCKENCYCAHVVKTSSGYKCGNCQEAAEIAVAHFDALLAEMTRKMVEQNPLQKAHSVLAAYYNNAVTDAEVLEQVLRDAFLYVCAERARVYGHPGHPNNDGHHDCEPYEHCDACKRSETEQRDKAEQKKTVERSYPKEASIQERHYPDVMADKQESPYTSTPPSEAPVSGSVGADTCLCGDSFLLWNCPVHGQRITK